MILENKKDCCGCSACHDICPVNAISMREDKEGFCYPEIDYSKCIKCNLCKKVCPVINVQKKPSKLQSFAAYNINEDVRLHSSSGGIFTLIAELVLNNGGSVYGAAFDENFEVRHVRITTKQEIKKLRGSKYVQSRCEEIYINCKKDLEEGRKVLFTGTPCQIQALKSYLRKEYDNLYCVDIICHGVPSRLVWRKYLEYRINFAKSKIEQIAFRLKNEGWKQYAVQFVFSNRTAYCQNLHKDIFMRGFLSDLYLRPSCYDCKFKFKDRVSDITIADFWGIDKIKPEIDDDKGVSLVIIHSKMGNEIFDNIKNDVIVEQVNLEDALKYNPSMVRSAKYNSKRSKFFVDLKSENKELPVIINKYAKSIYLHKIKNIIKKILRGLR